MNQKRQGKSLTFSDARWLAYAAAGVASAIGSGTSEAEIHYSGIINSKFIDGDFTKKFALDNSARLIFVYGYGVPYNGHFYYGAWFGIRGAAVSNQFRGYETQFGSLFVSRLAPGKPVSQGQFLEKSQSALAFLGGSYGNGAWGSRGQGQGRTGGFIGFRFDKGEGKQYGWARLRLRNPVVGVGEGFILVDYAWGDPGDAITTGQTTSNGDAVSAIPGSGSLGLLAMGGAGLQAWRESRKQIQTDAR